MSRLQSTMVVGFTALLLGACGATVLAEDGGGASGTGANGQGGSSGSSIGGSAGTAGTGGASAAIEQACQDYCLSGCVSDFGCSGPCAEHWGNAPPECLPQILAWFECMMPTDPMVCPSDQTDCWSLGVDVRACHDPFFCGAEPDIGQCSVDSNGSCSCSRACDQGHKATANCTWDGQVDTCDCFFDDKLAGHCTGSFESGCNVETSCCTFYWH